MVGVKTFTGEPIVAGSATGICMTSRDALSFWGGLNPETGEIIDRQHSLSGQCVTERVLVLPHGRGSCSGSGVLLEAIRNRTAPAAILVLRSDPIIALGSILGELLYQRTVPLTCLSIGDHEEIQHGELIQIEASGTVILFR